MFYPPPRLRHCSKAEQNVKIFEDYEEVNGVRTLVRSSCSQCRAEASGYKCNGLNADNSGPCVWNSFGR